MAPGGVGLGQCAPRAAELPGGPGLFAACAIPAAALEPQALAWAVGELVLLADEYDRLAAG